MRGTTDGFVCTKCGHQVKTEIVDVVKIQPNLSSAVDVLDPSKLEYKKVVQACPRCGNKEAFHSLGLVSGEACGRQAGAVPMQRYTCTKCGHSWSTE